MFSIHVDPVSCDDLDDALSVRWVCLVSCHIMGVGTGPAVPGPIFSTQKIIIIIIIIIID